MRQKITKLPDSLRPQRQGDVLLLPIDSIPTNAKPLKKQNTVTLAFGEATGHHHSFLGGNGVIAFSSVSEDAPLADYLTLTNEKIAELTHQEHIAFAPGKFNHKNFRVYRQTEYVQGKYVNVRD